MAVGTPCRCGPEEERHSAAAHQEHSVTGAVAIGAVVTGMAAIGAVAIGAAVVGAATNSSLPVDLVFRSSTGIPITGLSVWLLQPARLRLRLLRNPGYGYYGSQGYGSYYGNQVAATKGIRQQPRVPLRQQPRIPLPQQPRVPLRQQPRVPLPQSPDTGRTLVTAETRRINGDWYRNYHSLKWPACSCVSTTLPASS